MAVKPSASGSWCRSSLLGCLFGGTWARRPTRPVQGRCRCFITQAFVFFGDGGPLTPSKTKARLGNFCLEGGLEGWSSRRWRDAVAGRLTGDGGGESS